MQTIKKFTYFNLICLAIALPCFFIIYANPDLQNPMQPAALPLWLGMVWSPTLTALLWRWRKKESALLMMQLKPAGSRTAYLLGFSLLLVPLATGLALPLLQAASVSLGFEPGAIATPTSHQPLAWQSPFFWLQILLLLPMMHVVLGPLGEELGWRGLLLPMLLKQGVRPIPASLLVGLAWAGWHLPLWLLPDAPQAALPIWLFGTHVICYSFVLTAIYLKSQGSIWPAVLAHLLLNYGSDLWMISTGLEARAYFWLSLPFFLIFAIACLPLLTRPLDQQT